MRNGAFRPKQCEFGGDCPLWFLNPRGGFWSNLSDSSPVLGEIGSVGFWGEPSGGLKAGFLVKFGVGMVNRAEGAVLRRA